MPLNQNILTWASNAHLYSNLFLILFINKLELESETRKNNPNVHTMGLALLTMCHGYQFISYFPMKTPQCHTLFFLFDKSLEFSFGYTF